MVGRGEIHALGSGEGSGDGGVNGVGKRDGVADGVALVNGDGAGDGMKFEEPRLGAVIRNSAPVVLTRDQL